MKKTLILVLTNFFILTLILLGKPVKAQTTTITGQFLYGLQLYVLPEKQTTPDYSTAIYSSTIDENDFITSGLYENWLQPRLPDGINGYIYLVDSTHTIGNVYLGGGYLEQGQTLSYPYEPSIELKHYGAQLIDIFVLNPVNKYYYEAYGGRLDYIVYFENNDGTTPRIKLIDATTNENDYNRVKLAINGYDTGYNAGYSIGYNNGQVNGYNNGYEDGQNNGYNAGYNAGQYDFYNEYYQQIYDDGYKQGLNDASTPGYVAIQNFNQLCPNNITTGLGYTRTTSTITITDNSITNFNNGNCYIGVTTTTNHKYYIKIFSDTEYLRLYNYWGSSVGFNANDGIIRNENHGYNIMLGFAQGIENGTYELYINFIDLTLMYGVNNEPTIDQAREIFKTRYPYNTGEPININYIDGYNTGVAVGFDDGVSYQATQQLTSDGWIQSIFTGISSFLAIQILPGVSIGLIVGLPFIITVAWFVLKMARGGSSE